MSGPGGNGGRACAAVVMTLVLGAAFAPATATAPRTDLDSAAAALPPVRTVDPAKLKRGPDATFAHLQDGRIHAGGTTIRVRVPSAQGRQILLGRSGKAWLVASHRDGWFTIHRIRAGRTPQLVPGTKIRHGNSVVRGARLSRDGKRLLITTYDRGGATLRILRASDGAFVATYYTLGYDQAKDADAGHVLLNKEDEATAEDYAADWVPGSSERTLGIRTNAGFYRRDVVFVEAAKNTNRFGPTSISTPGVPSWDARFTALDISPDRTLVLGIGPNQVGKRAVLQIRRLSDGEVLQQFTYGKPFKAADWSLAFTREQTARFETNTRFVFQFTQAGRSRLVRCSTGGKCARASATGGGISTTYEAFTW